MQASLVVKLLLSLIIDLIGLFTFIIPGLGESADVVWAPVSAFLVHSLYHSPTFTALAAIEEILPFTDFIPTATLAWLYEYSRVRRPPP